MKNSNKRSSRVALVMMVPTASFWLQGCNERPELAYVYSSAEACAVAPGNDPARCLVAFDEARSRHLLRAPRYPDRAECEVDFGVGGCEGNVPRMRGFLASGVALGTDPIPGIPTQPLYQRIDEPYALRTAQGTRLPAGSALVRVCQSAITLEPALQVRRGGFGGEAARRANYCQSNGG
ncbi:DUF1190 domain-containing protein [Aeromonas dhakensis]|uniref:DUF1190 domain-containing protein n=2 Tax=Aeromonas dhakensis TaxID=196024 RepID=UPI000C0C02D2|nr:DUF1190 domain-containing protein [Aeromonas dhakensis]MBO2997383.1 DUF1190 domain-containing protein [Aeromonas dhakensis]